MREQGKRAIVESTREMCGSVGVGEGSPKNVWWNNEVKAAVKRKETAWRKCCEPEAKMQKKDVWEFTKKKRERLKRCIYQRKKGVHE